MAAGDSSHVACDPERRTGSVEQIESVGTSGQSDGDGVSGNVEKRWARSITVHRGTVVMER